MVDDGAQRRAPVWRWRGIEEVVAEEGVDQAFGIGSQPAVGDGRPRRVLHGEGDADPVDGGPRCSISRQLTSTISGLLDGDLYQAPVFPQTFPVVGRGAAGPAPTDF